MIIIIIFFFLGIQHLIHPGAFNLVQELFISGKNFETFPNIFQRQHEEFAYVCIGSTNK